MKKTIIAAAIATVAAAPAMAEVTIGGKMEQMQKKTEAGEWSGWSDVRLTVSGSEDLGNGMNAFFKMQEEFGQRSDSTDTAAATKADTNGTAKNYDQLIGLSGGFGTTIFGRIESLTESKVMGMVDKTMGAGSIETGNNLGRYEGGMAYVSPAMSGLTVAVAGFNLSNSGGSEDGFDATDVALLYSNGPLAANLAVMDYKDSSAGYGVTSVGLAYTAGDLGISATWQENDDDTAGEADETDTSVAITYAMGNNKLVLGWGNDEASASASATVTDTDSSVIELQHSFSKSTKAYVNFYNTDTADGDHTSIGLQHSF